MLTFSLIISVATVGSLSFFTTATAMQQPPIQMMCHQCGKNPRGFHPCVDFCRQCHSRFERIPSQFNSITRLCVFCERRNAQQQQEAQQPK